MHARTAAVEWEKGKRVHPALIQAASTGLKGRIMDGDVGDSAVSRVKLLQLASMLLGHAKHD